MSSDNKEKRATLFSALPLPGVSTKYLKGFMTIPSTILEHGICGNLNLCSQATVIHIWIRINSFIPLRAID